MAWQTPKTNWSAADGVRDSDFNRIEGNILELYNTDAVRSDLTVHVATTGSDSTGRGTSALPYATIAKALSVIPKNLNGKTVTINIAAGTYTEDVTIRDFSGGALILTSSGTVIMNSLTIINCTVKADFITISTAGGIGVFVTDGATFISNDAVITNGYSSGIAATNCSNVSIGGVLTVNNATVGVQASNGSRIFVFQLAGSGIGTGFNAFNGGYISYGTFNGTIDTAITATSTGGRVTTGSQTGSGGGAVI